MLDLTSSGSDSTVRATAHVPVVSLLLGESPRLAGLDKAHIERLAAVEHPLPPILVDRYSMRVVDGMHRFMAAMYNGRDVIEVEYVDGSPAELFLLAVEANVVGGLPLTRADRGRAVRRIVASHPQLPDRAIARIVGVGPRTVAVARRMAASKAEVRLRTSRSDPISLLDNLARDPSMRLSESGRRLLRVLRYNALGEAEWSQLAAAVPPHCRDRVAELAAQYEQMWLELAQELDARSREKTKRS